MLDPIAKEVWCEALRSGKFKQGRKTLHNKETNAYCCLGVASEIFPMVALANHLHNTLACPALEVLGLSEVDQEILIRMNDERGRSFAEIADYIEQNL